MACFLGDEPSNDYLKKLQGLFVSAIFYGTLTLQLPGGIICCQFSPKKILGLAVGLTSILNMLIPAVISLHYSAAIVVHFCQGLLFGVAFSASFQMWKFWAPPLEKSRLITTSMCGCYIGVVIGMPLSTFLITVANWAVPFYVYGMC
uniref:Major facilitator superfamily (MFS) profile domain-containing protein n=1 Tax=Romanomermis culicivorax TaxID=13658 RepID=A0A915I0T0_ROMCU